MGEVTPKGKKRDCLPETGVIEKRETRLLPVMIEGASEDEEARPLPVKQDNHPSETLQDSFFLCYSFN